MPFQNPQILKNKATGLLFCLLKTSTFYLRSKVLVINCLPVLLSDMMMLLPLYCKVCFVCTNTHPLQFPCGQWEPLLCWCCF